MTLPRVACVEALRKQRVQQAADRLAAGERWQETGPLEAISQLVGHSETTVTELVYRHQLRPVIQTAATVMDELFKRDDQSGSTGS